MTDTTEIEVVWWRALSGYDQGTKCVTYQVWDLRRRLVYVGIADNFEKRWAEHIRSSWWLGEVELFEVEVTGWPSREVARWDEAVAINDQSPVYNIARELAALRRADAVEEWPAPVERWIWQPVETAA